MLPPPFHDFELTTTDGLRLRGRHLPVPRPRAVVAIVHGLGEHYGRYHEVIRRFRAQDIACYALDQRGHGRSDGPRGYAPSYPRLLDDLALLLSKIKADQPDLPVFLYGQSMGGNLVSNYLLRRKTSGLAGALITSPWFRLRWSLRLCWIALSGVIKPWWPAQAHRSWLNPERRPSDPLPGVRFGPDALVHRRIHLRTFLAMHRAGHYAVRHASRIDLPVYVAHGSADPITSPAAARRFADRCRADFRRWPELLHETHHAENYGEVIDTMADWILRQTPPTA
jgi:acylglycerol lipase